MVVELFKDVVLPSNARDALAFGCQESLRGVSFLTAFVLLQVQLFDQAVGLVKDEAQAIAVLCHKEVGGTKEASAELLLSGAQRASDKGLVKGARRASDKELVKDAQSHGNHLKKDHNQRMP